MSQKNLGQLFRVEAKAAHSATVIFLHGLGDTGAGWKDVADILSRHLPYVRFLLPSAPVQPVTLNFGMQMPSWYDIRSLDSRGAEEDRSGIEWSVQSVQKMVESEIQGGLSSDRVIIGGFSQGGAISLYSGLTFPKKLGGVVALSTYLPLRTDFPGKMEGENAKVPVFQAHGDADMVVQYQWGTMSRDALKELGVNVDFHTYRGMQHSASMEEIDDLKDWLLKQIPPTQ